MVDPESNYGTIAILTHKGDLIDPTTEMIVEFNSISGRKVPQRRETGLFSRKSTIKLDGKLTRGLPGI